MAEVLRRGAGVGVMVTTNTSLVLVSLSVPVSGVVCRLRPEEEPAVRGGVGICSSPPLSRGGAGAQRLALVSVHHLLCCDASRHTVALRLPPLFIVPSRTADLTPN